MLEELPNAAHDPPPLPASLRYRYASPVTRAFLLDDDVYEEIASGPSPMSAGFRSLATILIVVVIAKVLAWIAGLLTQPRLGGIQTAIQNFIMGLPWYSRQVAATPGFADQFQQTYALAWQGIRTLLGQSTLTGMFGSILAFVIMTLVFWLVYAALAQLLARWFGGQASYKQLAGALALSYAPLLLLLIEIWPGAAVPVTLMFPLLLIFKYLAIRRTHGLAPAYTLAATMGPYLIGLIALAFLSLFGLALGLNSIPVVGDLLRMGGRLPRVGF